MKSLKFIHSAVAGQDPGAPFRLKPFNALTQKLSSITWKGLLSVAAIASVCSMTPDALATGTLRPGLAGPAVADLQRALGIHADGLYGPQTRAAVIAYQQRCGLLVDGIAGPQTLSTLYSGACPPGGYVAYAPSSSVCVDDCVSSLPVTSACVDPCGSGPYVVAIPGNDPELLAAVQRSSGINAFLDASNEGPFVNAGQFNQYFEAERLSNRLRGLGFDARVEYIELYNFIRG